LVILFFYIKVTVTFANRTHKLKIALIMKAAFTRNLFRYIQVAIYILLPAIMFAPPPPPNPGGTTPGTPIDAGLGFLLIAGASYGIKRVMDARKEKA